MIESIQQLLARANACPCFFVCFAGLPVGGMLSSDGPWDMGQSRWRREAIQGQRGFNTSIAIRVVADVDKSQN